MSQRFNMKAFCIGVWGTLIVVVSKHFVSNILPKNKGNAASRSDLPINYDKIPCKNCCIYQATNEILVTALHGRIFEDL